MVVCVAVAATALMPTAGVASAGGDRPGVFRVGAAVVDLTPPAFGAVGGDPANCLSRVPNPSAYNGPRRFAFEEPYIDAAHTGTYQPGDPFIDCNGNGRWDGILLGGGSNTPRFATTVADQVTARALVVSNQQSTIAVEVLDQEGVFNVYQQRIRERVTDDGYKLDGVFISATHDESAPDTIGISGVTQTTSGVDAYYVNFLVVQAAKAIEHAYDDRRPARIKYAEAIEPADLRQCFSSYPFVDDQLMPSLQAIAVGGGVHARAGVNGSVIATLGDVSQHAETLGFNPNPVQSGWISADWPHFFRSELERRYGGVAIEMAGSVGSNETPEVFSQPVSRVPQQFVDASHPAGCRTLYQPNGTVAPLGYSQETELLGRQLGGAVGDALDRSARLSTTNVLWGERRTICITLTNELFRLGAMLGVFAERPAFTNNCTVRIPPAPNGSTNGTELQSDVAAFRIGDAEFAAVPGEVFPFTFLRSFLGPQDMPRAQRPLPLPPWVITHMHAPYRFVDGLADDMIGYIFPRGNGVGVPGERNSGNGADRFGCSHSDDSEATSSHASDIIGTALVGVLDGFGGAPESVVQGRYVLPDGSLSRNPQGQPGSIKCNIDTVFSATGPAQAVWLPGANGGTVVPQAWMSLSGGRQGTPDRNTRGWIDADGTRHWLDVFPDIPGIPSRVVTPSSASPG